MMKDEYALATAIASFLGASASGVKVASDVGTFTLRAVPHRRDEPVMLLIHVPEDAVFAEPRVTPHGSDYVVELVVRRCVP